MNSSHSYWNERDLDNFIIVKWATIFRLDFTLFVDSSNWIEKTTHLKQFVILNLLYSYLKRNMTNSSLTKNLKNFWNQIKIYPFCWDQFEYSTIIYKYIYTYICRHICACKCINKSCTINAMLRARLSDYISHKAFFTLFG